MVTVVACVVSVRKAASAAACDISIVAKAKNGAQQRTTAIDNEEKAIVKSGGEKRQSAWQRHGMAYR